MLTPEPLAHALRRARRTPRALLWLALVALLVVAQSLLVLLTLRYEEARAQERADDAAAYALGEVRRRANLLQQALQGLPPGAVPRTPALAAPAGGAELPPGRAAAASDAAAWALWREGAAAAMRQHRELGRLEWRDRQLQVLQAVDSAWREPLFARWSRQEMLADTEVACSTARRTMAPGFSRSQFVPMSAGTGAEVVDLCVPMQVAGQWVGYVVATVLLPTLLDELNLAAVTRGHEISFVEPDGTRLARAGAVRGAGVYVADRLVDLPGAVLQVRADASERRPSLIPNLATALVLGLSIALFAVVTLLVRDGRRRARAESALAESLAFRKAMEDSLSTGLRARDRQGRIVYANPAFCAMVGWSADELMRAAQPPYWPPEQVPLYLRRQAERLGSLGSAGTGAAAASPSPPLTSAVAPAGADGPAAGGPGTPSREGYETEFMRRNGERFPVMVYEAPLVDGQGHHTGWMSAVLDLSAQRRVEELSRQQQERLQATARLASVGEMASLLSHELNQPLSAIASYAAGSLNLLEPAMAADAGPDAAGHRATRPGPPTTSPTTSPPTHQPNRQAAGQPADPPAIDPQLLPLMRHALERIAEQAERAGRVIKSVHDFVRRRHQAHEVLGADLLIDSVLPLVRLQARKSGAQIAVELPHPAPKVRVDRTMLEQVLLNLSRNGIQAMETHTPLDQRVLTLRVQHLAAQRQVVFSVVDNGPGIAPEAAEQLFTPFFTTKAEGMGLGLSLCRTVVEQHGGTLDYRHRYADPDPALAATPTPAPASAPADPTVPAPAVPAPADPRQPCGTEFRFVLPLADPARRAARAPETG